MKTYIALVRHGVTDWNYDSRAQGHSDIPLSAEGRRQAEAMAAQIATERWDAVYSSDLGRAQSTAQAICRLTGHQLIVEPRLKERNIGLAEGTTEAERQQRWPGLPWNSLPGLESNVELAERGRAVLSELASRHADRRIVVVSHGGLIAAFLRAVTDGSVPIGIPRNTGITRVTYDEERFALAAPHEFQHLLVDGVEYTGEKHRLHFEAVERSGLPGLQLPGEDAVRFILNATAVESAWVDSKLVGYARAFTDKVRHGYIDFIYTLPEHQQVRSHLIQRLQDRYPGVQFTVLTDRLVERSGA